MSVFACVFLVDLFWCGVSYVRVVNGGYELANTKGRRHLVIVNPSSRHIMVKSETSHSDE